MEKVSFELIAITGNDCSCMHEKMNNFTLKMQSAFFPWNVIKKFMKM